MSDTQSADVRVFERPADGLTEIIAGKLHGIRVTESKLNYHGSITIDTDILEAAHMLPLEFVYIWNKATGERISTYVLPGERGSGVCCLNGAADTSNGTANLIGFEQGSVNHKTAHAGIEQLWNLRREVDRVGIVQA